MTVNNLVFRLSGLCLFVLLLQTPDAQAGEWKTISLANSVIEFQNWPSTDDCRLGKKMADDYSVERTIAQCPRFPSRGATSTYILVDDLSPGYFWAGTKGEDLRESPIFNKSTGWFSNFYDAKFDPGQRFVCYRDSECAWRRLTFSVEGKPCQTVHIIPGVGGTNDFYGQRDSRLSLTLIHCGTDKPIGKKNIVYGDDKITLIYPGGGATGSVPGPVTPQGTGPMELQAKIAFIESERARSEQRCLYGETVQCGLANQKRTELETIRKKLKEMSVN